MDSTDSQNRRTLPRVREDLNVHITILSSPEDESLTGQEFDCHTKDISFQGMCIISDSRVYPGSKLDLQVQANTSSHTYSFSGMVMWCNHDQAFQVYDVGVQLMDLDKISIGWKKLVVDLLITS